MIFIFLKKERIFFLKMPAKNDVKNESNLCRVEKVKKRKSVSIKFIMKIYADICYKTIDHISISLCKCHSE